LTTLVRRARGFVEKHIKRLPGPLMGIFGYSIVHEVPAPLPGYQTAVFQHIEMLRYRSRSDIEHARKRPGTKAPIAEKRHDLCSRFYGKGF